MCVCVCVCVCVLQVTNAVSFPGTDDRVFDTGCQVLGMGRTENMSKLKILHEAGASKCEFTEGIK